MFDIVLKNDEGLSFKSLKYRTMRWSRNNALTDEGVGRYAPQDEEGFMFKN